MPSILNNNAPLTNVVSPTDNAPSYQESVRRAPPPPPPARNVLQRNAAPVPVSAPTGASAVAPNRVISMPKPSKEETSAKNVAKWTSAAGMAKIGAKIGMLGLAGAGVWFVVSQIIHLAHVGISAKAGGLLLPVGVAVAGTLVVAVVARAAYKGIKAINQKSTQKAQVLEGQRAMRFAFANANVNANPAA